MKKKIQRLRRAAKSRAKMHELGVNRLVINRTPRHIYAQVISGENGNVIASASTVEKTVRGDVKSTGNVDAAKHVGTLVAERALEAGVKQVAFDRSGFKYHGRVQALADAAREKGLQF
ncbi:MULTISPECIES: 50S ribosomal protein L18 [Kangiella]|uniref:Large ribosomal subunit protein uL18 n=2 Tax=Kangiella TaxID=261963 RepID=A0A2K9AW17_9GAMM|nr:MULTISPECIES: 50S ribosomal protein L18 [Kangiella]AUD78079.1 50S ribosomal protein L18 [Kangiella profundi]MBD3653001.1 50S ribosomal protein L18 [Kangiella sp.]WQG85248.1 50S ribosomal protein L18 [Kangiella aquimarina]GGF04891.1 50S ribosomal protein L18 [Kangiella profundi]